jgi:serine/threonine-protein kinase
LPEPGQILAGKYRIERLIGSGGMGAVFRAHHEILDRPVAIKCLLPESAARAEAVGRFLNEARAASRIHSEHVATVLDVGTLDTGLAYMVLEYLEGQDVGQLLSERETLSPREAVDIVLEALEAIAQAHALGIVHRDLKPANLFLARRLDGSFTVKVLDFGISKITAAASVDVTSSQATLGSPAYMSPEQVRSSKNVDARSDIWSLGVVLYRALSGRPPFEGENVGAVFAAILESIPRPLSRLRPDVPQRLSDVVARCLERDRERRYRHVAELAVELEPFASRKGRHSVEEVQRTLRVPGASGEHVAARARSIPPTGAFSDTVAAASPTDTPPPAGEGSSPSVGGRMVTASSSPGATGPSVETAAPWSGTGDPKRVRGRTLPVVLVGAALLAIGAIMLLRFTRHEPSAASATPVVETSAPATPSVRATEAPSATTPTTTAGVALDSASVAPSAAPTPTGARPSATAQRLLVPPATASVHASAGAHPSPTASAPQSPFDEQGLSNRH